MKTVFNHRELCHVWANELQEYGNGSRMFFEKGTIYSFGRHFPIAKHYEGLVLFTTQGYSMTTSGHKSSVRSAISNKEIVYCHYIPDNKNDSYTHQKNIKHWIDTIEFNTQKLARARKPEYYLNTIESTTAQMKVYTDLFKIKLTKEQKAACIVKNIDQYKEAIRKADEIKKIAEDKLSKIGDPLLKGAILAWKQYQSGVEFKDGLTAKEKAALAFVEKDFMINHVVLRTDGKQLETSKGIKLPVEVAHRSYQRLIKVIDKGGCNGDCGDWQISGYNVQKATDKKLVVGCHDIAFSEINEIALKLGWKK